MTLKEEMQKNRDEEIKRMKEEEVKEVKNKIRKRFLDHQSKDKKETMFEVFIVWYKDDLIFDLDEGSKLVSGMVSDKAKNEFMESLRENLEKEGIEMHFDKDKNYWVLTVELS